MNSNGSCFVLRSFRRSTCPLLMIERAVQKTLNDKIATADIARALGATTVVGTVEMGQAIIERLGE